MQFLWIGLGGFLGANARYLVQQWAGNRWGTDFPYGTVLANISGSFLIAFFLTLAAGRLPVSPELRLFVSVGFLGGFTTFSSFNMETMQLVEQARWGAAAMNAIGSTGLGLVAVFFGIFLARSLI